MNWIDRPGEFDLAALRAFHLGEGRGISLKEYERLYRVLLARGMSTSKRIYLDTNYWIQMRNVAQGIACPIYEELFERIRRGVRSRQLTCVFHHSSFMEAAKQDRDSLRLLASVIDEFTEGAAIAPIAELRENEARAYVARHLGFEYDDEIHRWTRAARMFKSDLPKSKVDRNSEVPAVVYKITLDYLLNLTLAEMLEELGDKVNRYRHDYTPQLIAELERLKASRLSEGHSRSATRRVTFRDAIASAYRGCMRAFLHQVDSTVRIDTERLLHQIEARAEKEFMEGTLGRFLSTGRIEAELHADYLRDDPNHVLDENTLIDREHAVVAIPHCHAFFTERNLTHKLVKVTGLAKEYECEVVWQPTEAIAVIDKLGV